MSSSKKHWILSEWSKKMYNRENMWSHTNWPRISVPNCKLLAEELFIVIIIKNSYRIPEIFLLFS